MGHPVLFVHKFEVFFDPSSPVRTSYMEAPLIPYASLRSRCRVVLTISPSDDRRRLKHDGSHLRFLKPHGMTYDRRRVAHGMWHATACTAFGLK